MTIDQLIAGLKEHYAHTAAPSLGVGRSPAVLVVDFIEGFTSKDSPLGGNWDEAVENTAEFIEAARALAGLPTIFTTVEYRPGETSTIILGLKTPRIDVLGAESGLTRLDHRLTWSEGDLVIGKKYGSAFFGTSLASQLYVMGIDTLFVTGCVTSGCVRASVVDAAQHGFRPLVIREAVGDRSRLANEANLMDIQLRYGDVISLDTALQYLQSFRQ